MAIDWILHEECILEFYLFYRGLVNALGDKNYILDDILIFKSNKSVL